MANTILIKRKTTTGAPSSVSLQTGEMCLVVPDKQVYIKNGDGTVTKLNKEITVSNTPPTSPQVGDLWVDTN
jgi:hypothetical protein